MALDRVTGDIRRWIVSVCSSTNDLFHGKYAVYAKSRKEAKWKGLKAANEEWPKGFSIRAYDIRLDTSYKKDTKKYQ